MSRPLMLTEHFSLEELALAGSMRLSMDRPSYTVILRLHLLAQELEVIRTRTGNEPIRISSGWRSAAVNRRVGGSPTSDHPSGYCADFWRNGWDAKDLFAFCRSLGQQGHIHYDQLIGYGGHVHISVHPDMRMMAWTTVKE